MFAKRFLCGFAFVLSGFLLSSFQLPKKLEKKVTKEIHKVFEISDYNLRAVVVPSDINKTLPISIRPDNFYAVVQNDSLQGYLFIEKAPSKTAQFDYMILFDADLIVKKTKVLVYREEYGGEIASSRWLKQFVGKTTKSSLVYKRDIAAISGATISVRSMTNAVNKVLKTVGILHNNKLI